MTRTVRSCSPITRWADGPTDANVIARSADGELFETVVTLDKGRWGAAMVERTTRLHYEARLPDESHELRSEVVEHS